jgi:hypothetical protein
MIRVGAGGLEPGDVILAIEPELDFKLSEIGTVYQVQRGKPPLGVERLMDEAEQTARRIGTDRAPADAGAIGMIRRNVEDAAHLYDDLLQEAAVAVNLECLRSTPCELAEAEKGTACPFCRLRYRLAGHGFGEF